MFSLRWLFVMCFVGVFAQSKAILHPSLQRSLRAQSSTNIIVSMKDGVAPAIHSIEQESFSSRGERIQALSDALVKTATTSQESVMKLLSQERFTHSIGKITSFWISNSIYIPNASPELIQELAQLPEVGEIHEENIIELEPIVEAAPIPSASVEWGISKVAADEVWNTYGNRGESIVIATIDTGVLGTHQSLKSNYLGNYGWYDPYDKSSSPNDQNGHGTHVTSTIVGTNGVGVAPGAKWMACKGCTSSGCTEAALLGCGQYVLCPTDVNGNNKDCSRAPHICSNSWGGGQGDSWYKETTKAWHAAGIIPVFANGNSGPSCGTANSPGDQTDVIGVGASTSSNGLASFSSVGPARAGHMKPDVSAPGQSIRAAWCDGDSSYKTISGTSMATPHTSGVIALMMSHKNGLSYSTIYDTLTGTCSTDLNASGKDCGGIDDVTYPNNAFGYGVIHAARAIRALDGDNPTPSPDTPTPAPTPAGCYWDDAAYDCLPADECRWSWWNWACVRN